MDYVANFFEFLDSYGSFVIYGLLFLFFAVYAVVKIWSLGGRNEKLQESLDDQVELHKVSLDRISDLELMLSSEKGTVLTKNNEIETWKNRCRELEDVISRKKQHRLKDGTFCSEDQYFAELNAEVTKIQDGIRDVDINEEANRQIDKYLKK